MRFETEDNRITLYSDAGNRLCQFPVTQEEAGQIRTMAIALDRRHKLELAAQMAFTQTDDALARKLTGEFQEGKARVTWFVAASCNDRRWEIVAADATEAAGDACDARAYLALPTLMDALVDIELKLDAALNPTFEANIWDTNQQVQEAHDQLRGLLGMPAIARGEGDDERTSD